MKAIYLYPLAEDWAGAVGHRGAGADPAAGMGGGAGPGEMGENELGGARLGDQRLSRRLVRSAWVQAEAPMASFSSAAQSDKAMVMGYYRMIDQPADSEVTPENILAPHRWEDAEADAGEGGGAVPAGRDGSELRRA